MLLHQTLWTLESGGVGFFFVVVVVFLFSFWFGLVFQDWVSLCSPRYPGTLSVGQVGLELTEIFLPLPPEY